MATTTDCTCPKKGIDVVAIRLIKKPRLFPHRKIATTEDAVNCIREELSLYDRETFCVLNLCTDGSVINFNEVSLGSLNSAVICPREVFKSCILSNASAVIFFHNHPSGNTKPSQEDYLVTKRLVETGELLGIKVVDHIIVAANTGAYLSLRSEDVLGIF